MMGAISPRFTVGIKWKVENGTHLSEVHQDSMVDLATETNNTMIFYVFTINFQFILP